MRGLLQGRPKHPRTDSVTFPRQKACSSPTAPVERAFWYHVLLALPYSDAIPDGHT